MAVVPAHADIRFGKPSGREVSKTPTVKAITLAGLPHTVTLPPGWVIYSAGDGGLLEKPGKRYKVWIRGSAAGQYPSAPKDSLERWLRREQGMKQKIGVTMRKSEDATFVGAPGRVGMLSWTEGEDFKRFAQMKVVISLSRDIEYQFKLETEVGAMTDDEFQSDNFMREINAIYASVTRL